MKQSITTLFAGGLLAFVLFGVAVAGPFEEGTAALGRGDFAMAMQLLLPFANQGHASAQYGVGVMYALGEGVLQDDAQAALWFRKAADQGMPPAQAALGDAYLHGAGVQLDPSQALFWFRKAAESGDPDGQMKLGFMYEMGFAGSKDIAQAVLWDRKAADQGNPLAQEALGSLYFKGDGVLQDYVQAYMWLNLAAARAEAEYASTRDAAIQERNEVAAKMTPEQIAEAQKLAREWKPSVQPAE
jgi:TPR repeat protein